MTLCPVCAVDVHPMMELEPNGSVTETCPTCTVRLPKSTAAVAPQAATQRQDSPKGDPSRVPVGAPADPVAALRSRLQAVEALIPTPEQLKALRLEQRQLRAALKALGAT